jgi:hypothetical protein
MKSTKVYSIGRNEQNSESFSLKKLTGLALAGLKRSNTALSLFNPEN